MPRDERLAHKCSRRTRTCNPQLHGPMQQWENGHMGQSDSGAMDNGQWDNRANDDRTVNNGTVPQSDT
jgi:hypothetical protein